jgi:DNA-binding FrmR family transcriptional regulator/copper chaperone CopZ
VSPELTAQKHAVLDRVNTVRGQLDEIIRMLESDAYCVEVMKQIQAVQSSLERANRVTLHNHLETCFSDAVLYGRGQAAIDELVDAVKFTPASTGLQPRLDWAAVGEAAASNTKQLLATTILSLPGISSQRCKAAIEGIVTPIAGVVAVDVDVPTKTITIHHDNRAPARRLIDAVEDQGYHVALPMPRDHRWRKTGNHDPRWDRGGAHDGDRGPGATTSASSAVPGEQAAVQAWLGFVDGGGI